MSYLNHNGVNIYFEDHGKGDKTIILSHGYSATSAMWRDQVDAFKGQCRVIVWDMCGHGLSDSPDDASLYSEQHTVEDMAALFAECGIEQAITGGLSLGGYMSLAFNLVYGDKVSALMLFDTGPGYKSNSARDGWNKMAGLRAEEFEKNGLAALGTSKEVQAATHTSAQGLAHAARGMLSQKGDHVIKSLPEIKVPALVLVGDADKAFIAPTNYMAGKIPGAKKVTIDSAGHASNIDQPTAFNDAVSTFLDSLD
jgi:pimeloyl-ACP methyl ester carboxylesterase